MTSPLSQATGFFRFPARITTRLMTLPVRAVRAEWAGCDTPRVAFHIRHGATVPAPSQPPKQSDVQAVQEGAAPRITLRV